MAPADEYADAMRTRYVAGETPWDTGRPNAELLTAIEAGRLPGKTVLEFGCGTGTNAIALAEHGYRVTAVDLVDLPVARARTKAQVAGVDVDFRVGDLTTMNLGGPYDVLFDCGVYHGIRVRDLAAFLRAVQRTSRPGTHWLSLAGNAREPHPTGPPVVRREEIESELGGLFEFLDVHEFRFDLGPGFQPLAWSILMRRV